MKNSLLRITLGCVLIYAFSLTTASGQTFNARKFGTMLSKQPAPGSADQTAGAAGTAGATTVGSITGGERFLRDNRRGGSFVGLNPQQGFIGDNPTSDGQPAQPTTPQFNLVTPGIPYNTPRTPARQTGPYEPKLVVAFDYDQAAEQVTGANLKARLVKLDQQRFGRTTVVVSKGIAHLTGQVSSSHDRDLAADLLAFEPGVVRVRNDLVVTSTIPPAPRPR